MTYFSTSLNNNTVINQYYNDYYERRDIIVVGIKTKKDGLYIWTLLRHVVTV